MKITNTASKTLSIIIFVIFVCLILVINGKTPLIGEDYVLAIPYEYQNVSANIKLPLLFNKIGLQVQFWSARVGEQLAIIFASYDKEMFNILNTALFFIFCYFIVIFARGEFPPFSRGTTFFLLTFAASIIIIFIPTLGEIFFWLDGSTNYLWSLMILLFFFMPYRMLFAGKDVFVNKPLLVAMFYLLAIFTGFTNENTVPAILAINLLQLLLLIKKKENRIRLPKWQWIGTIICSISFASFVFLPSTRHRQEYYNSVYGVTNPDLAYYWQRAKLILTEYGKTAYILILVVLSMCALFIFIALIKKWRLSAESQKSVKIIIMMLGLSFVSQVIMVIVPYYERRTGLLTWFFWIVLLIFVVEEFRKQKSPIIYVTALVVIFGLMQTVNIVKVYDQFYKEAMARHYLLLRAESEGLEQVQVEPFTTQYSRVITTREDYLLFENKLYANYYGLDRVDIYSNKLEP